MEAFLLIVLILGLLSPIFFFIYYKKRKQYNALYERYKEVIDIEEEKVKVLNEIERLSNESYLRQKTAESELIQTQNTIEETKKSYAEKKSYLDKLLHEISILEEDLEFISFGVYKPHFDFDTSERFKTAIKSNQDKQKQLIKNKNAAICPTEWTVQGSKAEGKKMTDRSIKMILRAFNGECDSAIAKVKWNNVDKMEQRIKKAYEALNKLGEPNHISITNSFLKLKLEELFLSHEYEDKKYQEKEEQRQLREQIREEEKVQREIEKAQKDAEKEEERYQKALEKAWEEMEKASDDQKNSMNEKIRELEEQLRLAHENKERALSMAQQTKAGHVYVISNIGSFGEGVYKVGMTRRIEPLDRVKELGDASVPFEFDVHAMIYSENAPELESKLHKHFDRQRLNLINRRKEFFYIKLSEIEEKVKEEFADIQFTKLAQAREFRESEALRRNPDQEAKEPALAGLPAFI